MTIFEVIGHAFMSKRVAGPLVSGSELIQIFVASEDFFSSISISMATYDTKLSSRLSFSLFRLTGSGGGRGNVHHVATFTASGTNVINNAFFDFCFEPENLSAGHLYMLKIWSDDATLGNAATVWLEIDENRIVGHATCFVGGKYQNQYGITATLGYAPSEGGASTFNFMGYDIPIALAVHTGGGPDTFVGISKTHLSLIEKFHKFQKTDHVFELGCGIGRDAIPITTLLSERGHYYGADIDLTTIEWCQENITALNRNFDFFHFDIQNDHFNPNGKCTTRDCRLPAPDNSVDLVILQSIFTHLNKSDIAFYFGEFQRILKPGGKIYCTLFIVDDACIARLRLQETPYLEFKYRLDEDCWTQNDKNPTHAYGYQACWIERVAHNAGFKISSGPYFGWWSNQTPSVEIEPDPGQDLIVFEKQALPARTYEPPMQT